MRRISVIICNYNYAHFLSEAVESALALRWPEVEVIIVDDGSTDDSRAVIESFGDTVTSIFTENRGQRTAANRGFAASTGDVVVFLDADDALPERLPECVAARWTTTTSKWQFRMQRVDHRGLEVGSLFPEWCVPGRSDLLTKWLVATSAYPTPPGSGNAYARWFLEQVLPIGPEVGEASDSALLVSAPLLGDVTLVPDVIVKYRRHESNDSDLLTDPSRRFAREVARAHARWKFACELEAAPALSRTTARKSRELVQLRTASYRLHGSEDRILRERFGQLLFDIVRAPIHPGPEHFKRRAAITAWCLLMLVSPDRYILPLLRIRYAR